MAAYSYPPAYDPYASAGYGAPYAAHPYGGPPSDEIRTVFITGFPDDVKERELNNLLRFIPGYQASQMNWKDGAAQGFALFDTGMNARTAMNMIAQIQFDEASVLRTELARKNMYVKDDGIAIGAPPAKRARHGEYGAAPPGLGGPPGMAPVAPQGFAPVSNHKDNPPCSTLFIGNLADSVSETELRGLFGAQPGFKQLKLMKNGRNVTCFCDFDDLQTAMTVHTNMQGAVLTSSDRGGIRIQYSKNPLGKRRDAPY